MDKQELISVIIPIYNVERFLERCVKSVLSQTYSNIQIILVDDGSPDHCPQICDFYAEEDKRIEVIHKKNGGLSDARNAGLQVAKGKWIAFIDSDDVVSDRFLEYLYAAANENVCDIAVCKFATFENNIPNIKEPYQNPQVVSGLQMLDRIYSNNHAEYLESTVAWNKLYKRKLFEQIEFPKGKIHEDEATTYKLFYSSKKVAILNEQLYFYYQNSEGIMKSRFNVHRLDYLDALRERYIFYKQKNLKLLADKTAKLLYIFVVDYASLEKTDVTDYDEFMGVLKCKYRKIWPILIRTKFERKERVRIWISYIFFNALTIRV